MNLLLNYIALTRGRILTNDVFGLIIGEDEDDWGGGDIGGAKGDRVASNSLFPTFEPMEASKHNNSSLVPDASNA